jgi:hypothetical protein
MRNGVGKTMSDDSERLTKIANVFGTAIKQACESGEGKVDEQVTLDPHPDYVRVLVGGHSKVLFNINREGSIRGPVLGFQDTANLGSINDDGVELNIAWTIKNELSNQLKRRSVL